MTRDEVKAMVIEIAAVYPSFKPNTKEELSTRINMWHRLLEEYDRAEMESVLTGFIKSDLKGFPPTVGQLIALREKYRKLSEPPKETAISVWTKVLKAIRNSSYNSVEEFGKLPELAQKVLGSPATLRDYAISENFNYDVAQSNFVKRYEQMQNHYEEQRTMPKEYVALLENAKQKLLNGGTDNGFTGQKEGN